MRWGDIGRINSTVPGPVRAAEPELPAGLPRN